MARLSKTCLFVAAGALLTSAPLGANDAVDYLRHVKPILKSRCYACHGSLKQAGGFRLDTVGAMLTGGGSGPAIEPGDIEASYLVDRITDADAASRMPQEGSPLKAEEIAKIQTWIAGGAAAPTNDQPESNPLDHWAFKRPKRPSAPDVERGLNVRNPIDAFVSQKLQQRAISPVSEADKATLLRRLYVDLIGLPPTRDQLQELLADESPDAYENVVDQLLASPQYGERWGRHWMDVWRYSDWYGRRNAPDVMNSWPTIWRWRDWIIRSLNSDKGYDRMIVEMLAADEVSPEDESALVATGFLVRNWFKWNYSQWMKDNVEHTGKAFLGLTFNCAHCHDHKYDPISHRDYFAMRAFFEPLDLRLDRVPGEADPGRYKEYVYPIADPPITVGMVRVMDQNLNAETRVYARGDERMLIEGEPPVQPGLPAFLGFKQPRVKAVQLPPVAANPGLKPFIVVEDRARARAAKTAAKSKRADAAARLAAQEPALLAVAAEAQRQLSAASARLAQQTANVLTGRYSLFIDAFLGRRTLSRDVSIIGEVRDGTELSFQLLLLKDGHASLQLARDPSTGATAAFVGFEQGRIISFAPGASDIIQIGHYDLGAGQNRFQVTATLDVTKDRLVVNVVDLAANQVVVDEAVVALNGWNPGLQREQQILLDVRPGTVAVFDKITLNQPGANPAVDDDFEVPAFTPQQDAIGRAGWISTYLSTEPAISLVSSVSTLEPDYLAARLGVHQAQRSLAALRLSLTAAQEEVAAAEQDALSLEARIVASEGVVDGQHGATCARAASQAERVAAHTRSLAALAAAEHSLADIEAKAGGAAEIQTAQAAVATAREKVAATAAARDVASEKFTPLVPIYHEKSTGRRTALAQAIVHPENPLTARVAVNHIWMRHFGQPLVETVFDFGRNGKPPSHPELLDWLAVELLESGWSMKHIHRLIVTSAVYRLDSKTPADAQGRLLDPDNKLLWRYSRNRMDAEVVRDSILHMAGRLDATMGGPEIEQKDAAASRRRSLYLSHHGETREQFMSTFDGPDPNDCYRRSESVVPQQALALANGDLAIESARAIAEELWEKASKEAPSDSERDRAFVTAAFEHLLSRQPTNVELGHSLELLKRQAQLYRSTVTGGQPRGEGGGDGASDLARRARHSLTHSLLSHHDFISVR